MNRIHFATTAIHRSRCEYDESFDDVYECSTLHSPSYRPFRFHTFYFFIYLQCLFRTCYECSRMNWLWHAATACDIIVTNTIHTQPLQNRITTGLHVAYRRANRSKCLHVSDEWSDPCHSVSNIPSGTADCNWRWHHHHPGRVTGHTYIHIQCNLFTLSQCIFHAGMAHLMCVIYDFGPED